MGEEGLAEGERHERGADQQGPRDRGLGRRMNELKEKECPGSATAGKDEKKAPKKKALGSEAAKEVEALEKEIEEYRLKLKSEFGYSNKDINADPDMADMLAKLKQFKK